MPCFTPGRPRPCNSRHRQRPRAQDAPPATQTAGAAAAGAVAYPNQPAAALCILGLVLGRHGRPVAALRHTATSPPRPHLRTAVLGDATAARGHGMHDVGMAVVCGQDLGDATAARGHGMPTAAAMGIGSPGRPAPGAPCRSASTLVAAGGQLDDLGVHAAPRPADLPTYREQRIVCGVE